MTRQSKRSFTGFPLALALTLTLCAAALGLQSCSSDKDETVAPKAPASTSKAPIDKTGLPIIKVDQEHIQMTEPGSKQTIYEMPESKAFILDLSEYKIKSLEELSQGKESGGEKNIQLIAGKDQIFDLPFADEQRITVEPPFLLEKGKRLAMAVGYKKVVGETERIYPVWVGLIDVK